MIPGVDRERAGEELSTWLESVIKDFCSCSPENSLGNETDEKAWDKPHIGFSSGADPLYQRLKEDIGQFYLTPLETFQQAFPNTQTSPGELTVISWILPQTEATKADNRRETAYPAERWVRSKQHGEAFNSSLRRHVVEVLRQSSVEAVAPFLAPFWSMQVSERYGLASNWSERHAAHVSGLGTFGLCDGLITPLGKAMRCGSVVARILLPPTVRPYTDHHEYCLHFSRGTCGKCIKRCPVGAITEQGHDKGKCFDYLRQFLTPYVKNRFGLETDACGLCQTGTPCESRIPLKEKTQPAS
jgi:epoxyqueuosine reductase